MLADQHLLDGREPADTQAGHTVDWVGCQGATATQQERASQQHVHWSGSWLEPLRPAHQQLLVDHQRTGNARVPMAARVYPAEAAPFAGALAPALTGPGPHHHTPPDLIVTSAAVRDFLAAAAVAGTHSAATGPCRDSQPCSSKRRSEHALMAKPASAGAASASQREAPDGCSPAVPLLLPTSLSRERNRPTAAALEAGRSHEAGLVDQEADEGAAALATGTAHVFNSVCRNASANTYATAARGFDCNSGRMGEQEPFYTSTATAVRALARSGRLYRTIIVQEYCDGGGVSQQLA
jgi:hypothetical protein